MKIESEGERVNRGRVFYCPSLETNQNETPGYQRPFSFGLVKVRLAVCRAMLKKKERKKAKRRWGEIRRNEWNVPSPSFVSTYIAARVARGFVELWFVSEKRPWEYFGGWLIVFQKKETVVDLEKRDGVVVLCALLKVDGRKRNQGKLNTTTLLLSLWCCRFFPLPIVDYYYYSLVLPSHQIDNIYFFSNAALLKICLPRLQSIVYLILGNTFYLLSRNCGSWDDYISISL